MANVLIIDDDEDVTRLLETHLTDEGHRVVIMHDGKTGMEHLVKNVPDLIMLDVFLPDATGYQMCNRIRKNEATKTTPIIMMTGAARFPNQQMYGRQRGANEYIFKPFDIVQVGELVSKYITAPAKKAAVADPLQAIHAFLQRTSEPETETQVSGTFDQSMPEVLPMPAADPLISFGQVHFEPTPPITVMNVSVNGNAAVPSVTPANGNGSHPSEPVASIPAPEPALVPVQPSLDSGHSKEPFVPPSLGSEERFLEFGMDVYDLASRLSGNPAEKYLAGQLLRTSLSVGAQLHALPFAATPNEFLSLAAAALHDLREASYWLLLTRKAGVLEKLTKRDLEKTCQLLIALLTDFADDKKTLI